MPKINIARFFPVRSQSKLQTGEYSKLFPLISSRTVVPIHLGGREFSPTMVTKSLIHLDKWDFIATGIKNHMVISLFQKQLAQSKMLHGENNVHIVPMIHQLGEAYLKQSNVLEAKKSFTEALNIINKELKKTASEPVLFQAAETYRYLGLTSLTNYESNEAIKFYNRSLEMKKLLHRELHVANVEILFELAMAYMTENDFFKALECYKKLIAINDKAIARNTPHWEEGFTCLGVVALLAGDFTNALEYQNKSLECLRLPAEKKPDKFITQQLNAGTVVELNNLGCTLATMGNTKDARDKFEESANIITAIYGDNHPLLEVNQKNITLIEKTCSSFAKETISLAKNLNSA